MSGGDIPSLTDGNLTIFNNTLHRFARVSRRVLWPMHIAFSPLPVYCPALLYVCLCVCVCVCVSVCVCVCMCVCVNIYSPAGTVRVGVSWHGCGNTVSHNEVYDAPQIGMIGGGVNMLFEDNDLHDLAKGTADTGGFYAGRTWADRGNIVRRNKFRRFYQVEKMAQSTSVNGM